MNSHIRLAYTPLFKQFVRVNPGVVRKFWHAYRNGLNTHEEGGVEIRRLRTGVVFEKDGSSHRNGQVHRTIWRVEAGGKELFVKETLRKEDYERQHFTGYRQYRLTMKFSKFAKLLSKFWKHDLQVLEPHLGANYWDTSFIVMDYLSKPMAGDIALPKKLEKQFWVFSHLATLFGRFWDLKHENSAYDRQAGKIIMYDPGRAHDVFPIRAVRYSGKLLRYAAKKAYRAVFKPKELKVEDFLGKEQAL